jgi:hypothetical protein
MRRSLAITVVAVGMLLVSGAPQAHASDMWAIQPTPLPAAGKSGALYGVSCTAVASCTAVGWYASHGGMGAGLPLAEYWDGSTWAVQPMPSPSGSTGVNLNQVSCTSAGSCTAVGDYTTGSGERAELFPLAEYWDGSTWAVQPVPSPSGGIDAVLDAVSCTSAGSCTAVGDYFNPANVQSPLAEYWDGSTWTVQATPFRRDSELLAVSCTAPGRCFAVGSHLKRRGAGLLFERSRSGTWRSRAVPAPSGMTDGELAGISCTRAASCTAVGDYTTGSGNARVYLPLAEHRDGSTWTIQPVPGHPGSSDTSMGAVSCVSVFNCTATGEYETPKIGFIGLAFRYYHGTWRRETTASPAGGKLMSGISCTSASACTAVGWHRRTNQPLAEQRSGG